jgi:hypothetical protein
VAQGKTIAEKCYVKGRGRSMRQSYSLRESKNWLPHFDLCELGTAE